MQFIIKTAWAVDPIKLNSNCRLNNLKIYLIKPINLQPNKFKRLLQIKIFDTSESLAYYPKRIQLNQER